MFLAHLPNMSIALYKVKLIVLEQTPLDTDWFHIVPFLDWFSKVLGKIL